MTLTTLAAQHQRFLLARGASPRTAECYQLSVQQFVEYLRTRGCNDDVREFTPENLEGFVTWMGEHEISANSMNVKLASLSSLGKYGRTQRDGRGRFVLDENPLDRVIRPKKTRRPERFLYLDELRALLAVPCVGSEHLAVALLVDTALRVGEIVDAKVRDLSPAGERVKLAVTVKGGDRRELLLGTETGAKLLDSLRFREARPDDPLLVRATGGAYSRTSFSEMILRLAKKAGVTRVPVRAHIIRHSIATLATEHGADVPAVAGMLNHSGIQTVSTYVHRRDARVEEVRDKVREVLRG